MIFWDRSWSVRPVPIQRELPRIGYTARQLFDEPVKKAEVYLHGSFAATGKGHGTDRAIIAGLLGMKPDDLRIPVAFEEAKKAWDGIYHCK